MRSDPRNRQSATGTFTAWLCLVCFSFFLIAAFALPVAAQAQAITSDSRIKTFVYNPNEVFTLTTHYGYQSNIEFGPKESIDTISVGDRVAWQIIPAGRRLFIRAMEENARTNMTIVTNLHAYQFDLRSSGADAVFGSEQLTYVVRFFYPLDATANGGLPSPTASAQAAPPPAAHDFKSPPPMAIAPPSPPPAAPPPASSPPQPSRTQESSTFNYRYTFSGPSDIAPTKIYDDGKTTYFKLPGGSVPRFAIVTARGESVDVAARRTEDGLMAVDAIAPRFRLDQTGRQVTVYNEAGSEVR